MLMQLPLRTYYSTQIIWQCEGFTDPLSSLLARSQTQPPNIKHIWYFWLKIWMIGNFRVEQQHTDVFTAHNKYPFCLHLLPHDMTWEGSHVRQATACRAMKPELWSQTPVSAQSLVRCPAKIVNIQHVTSPKYTKYDIALAVHQSSMM